jgi:hypothetical protein
VTSHELGRVQLRRFVSIVCCHVARSQSRIDSFLVNATLLTSASSRPNRSATNANRPSIAAASAKSTANAVPPIASATARASSACLDVTTT